MPPEERLPPEVRQLTPAQKRERVKEFQTWIRSYPKNLPGDPKSRYFKPPTDVRVFPDFERVTRSLGRRSIVHGAWLHSNL